MLRLPAFLGLLLRYGTLQPCSPDYARYRRMHLGNLQAFLPLGFKLVSTGVPSNWRAFVGHVVSALKQSSPGHLLHPFRSLYYIRIPRSGGTSLARAFLTARYPHLPDITPTQMNLLCDAWLSHKVNRSLKTRTGFAVVRHPLHRLVSVYRNFFEQPHDDIFIYQGYLFNILQPGLSFEEFVRRVVQIPVRMLDRHLLPQHLFLQPYLRKNLPLRVFRLEEPENLRLFLSQNEMTLYRENASNQSYDYRDYYTPTIKKRALELYDYDCRVFGYGQ